MGMKPRRSGTNIRCSICGTEPVQLAPLTYEMKGWIWDIMYGSMRCPKHRRQRYAPNNVVSRNYIEDR